MSLFYTSGLRRFCRNYLAFAATLSFHILEITLSLVSREWLNRVRSPKYEYKRLSERHIRLLRLQRDPSGFHCELLLHSLDLHPAPSFEAISYTWGNFLKTHSLTIENCSLPITKNAHEILSKFASTSQSRLLWIDAICS